MNGCSGGVGCLGAKMVTLWCAIRVSVYEAVLVRLQCVVEFEHAARTFLCDTVNLSVQVGSLWI